MTSETIETLLHDYYAAWGTGDTESVLSFFRDDSVFEDLAFVARFEGLEEIRGFIELTYSGSPDFQVVPTHLIIGDLGSGRIAAAAEWTMSGTHAADLPGLPSTGRPFEVRASSIIRLESNKILGIQDYWNLDTFRKSVGLL